MLDSVYLFYKVVLKSSENTFNADHQRVMVVNALKLRSTEPDSIRP